MNLEDANAETRGLLARVRKFCFPTGEEAARGIRAVKTTQRGEFRAAAGAKWMLFTAEEFIESTRSSFRWDARMGSGIRVTGVTDAYEEGHGRVVVKAGGVIPVKRMTGPEFDKGELQRYLASVVFCPPMLLNHRSLDCTAAGPLILRMRDRDDPTGATIQLELNEEGRPAGCRAQRPMLAGKEVPWSAVCGEFREWEGLQIANRLEVTWELPEGPFTYFRAELTSFKAVR